MYDPKRLQKKLRWIESEIIDHAEQIVEKNPSGIDLREDFEHILHLDIQEMMNAYQNMVHHTGIQLVDQDDLTHTLQHEPVLFEGAQGILLDPILGFSPHVTKTRTTPLNAQNLLERAGIFEARILGVTRSYLTRHGMGPFPTEMDSLQKRFLESHNLENQWQGKMRFGWLDLVLLNYACSKVPAMKEIALTHLDSFFLDAKISRKNQSKYDLLQDMYVCTAYKNSAGDVWGCNSFDISSLNHFYGCTPVLHQIHQFETFLEQLPCSVSIQSFGPTIKDKKFISS